VHCTVFGTTESTEILGGRLCSVISREGAKTRRWEGKRPHEQQPRCARGRNPEGAAPPWPRASVAYHRGMGVPPMKHGQDARATIAAWASRPWNTGKMPVPLLINRKLNVMTSYPPPITSYLLLITYYLLPITSYFSRPPRDSLFVIRYSLSFSIASPPPFPLYCVP